MGTHPIFESDFDCLTELIIFVMSDNPRNAARRTSIDWMSKQGSILEQPINMNTGSMESIETKPVNLSTRRASINWLEANQAIINKTFTKAGGTDSTEEKQSS